MHPGPRKRVAGRSIVDATVSRRRLLFPDRCNNESGVTELWIKKDLNTGVKKDIEPDMRR